MLNAKIHVQHLHGLNGALANQDIVTKITERKIESESGIKNRQFQVNEMYPSMSRWKNRGFQNDTHHIRTKIALEHSDIKTCTSLQIDLTQTCIFSRGIRLFAVFDCILTTTDRKVLKTKKNISPF